MKFYIDTTNPTPVPTSAAASTSTTTTTDPDGTLQVYTARVSSSSSASLSSLAFKRGTTVDFSVVLTGGADDWTAETAPALRYALKVSGEFDTALAVLAEPGDPPVKTAEGWEYAMKVTFSSELIDAALAVNNTAEDDAQNSAFSSEFSWTTADGETSATSTIATTIYNNVYRPGDSVVGAIGKNWTQLIVIACTFSEYETLLANGETAENTLYFITDAPNEIEVLAETLEEETQAREAAVAELDAKISDTAADIETAIQAETTARELALAELANRLNNGATTNDSGAVKLGTDDIVFADYSAPVGKDGAGQLRVSRATASAFGVVKAVTALSSTESAACPTAATVKAGIATAQSETAEALEAKADLVDPVFRIDKTSATPSIDGSPQSANFSAFFGTLAALTGREATGEKMRVETLANYRRSGSTPNNATSLYARISRWDGTGWQTVQTSRNGVKMGNQGTANLPCETWIMETVDGMDDAIPDNENVVITMVADSPTATIIKNFGSITVAGTGGVGESTAKNWASADFATPSSVVPRMAVTWTTGETSLSDLIAALENAGKLVPETLTDPQTWAGINIFNNLWIGTDDAAKQIKLVPNAAGAGLQIQFPTGNTVFLSAANSGQVALTAHVSAIYAAAKTWTAEQTFSVAPRVPAATEDDHPATLAQLNAAINALTARVSALEDADASTETPEEEESGGLLDIDSPSSVSTETEA